MRLLLIALGVALSTGGAVAQWPGWGGPGQDYAVADPGLSTSWPATGPREIWRRPLGSGNSGLAASDGVIFTGYREAPDDIFAALDAATGETLWRHRSPAPDLEFMAMSFGSGPHSTPLVTGDLVIVAGTTGRLTALERTTGIPRWRHELWSDLGGTRLERGYAASPIAVGDLVIAIAGGDAGAVIAFRRADGSVAWRAAAGKAAYASPVLLAAGGRTHLVCLLDRQIVGLDPATGALLWHQPVDNSRYVHTASPVVSGNRVYLTTVDGGRVLEIEAEADGFAARQVWLEKSIGSQIANAVWSGETLFGVRGWSTAKYYVAVETRTGEQLWRDRSIGAAMTLRAGDKLIALEETGQLSLLAVSDQELTRLATATVLRKRAWTAPILVGSTLYARDRHEIVALALGNAD